MAFANMTVNRVLGVLLAGPVVLIALVGGCRQGQLGQLFEEKSAPHAGLVFSNDLVSTEELNTYVFRNFYNGGGVAIGDVNNDGHKDVFLTANQVSNRLFLGSGDARFKDVTAEAGLLSDGIWTTGVSMADVNGDGWLDLYLCKSGPPQGSRRHNELFINNGDGTFVDRAPEYGLDITALSIHASFFDYDRDGDLDAYLLSNPVRSLDDLQRLPGLRDTPDPAGGNKLFRNELISGGVRSGRVRFTDVTREAGLYSSIIGFGLGVSVADLDRDGWPDLYVSNDFFERDYLYINNRDGTFQETLAESMGDISLSSMGGDIADINRDGLPEIFVSDMLPRAPGRLQSKIAFPPWSEYLATVRDGYHFQHTRNSLQLNRGDLGNVGELHFSEVGRMTGIDATDWSWGGLFADFDHDGNRDLFVPNGIFQDLLDQDYLTRISDADTLRAMLGPESEPILHLVSQMPSSPLANFMFAGTAGLRFRDVSAEWGLSSPSFSNGSAYGDLDGDGDLDLVISNVNSEPGLYLNRTSEWFPERRWLQVDLRGQAPNTYAVGAQVTAWYDGSQWYAEQQPVRGFQSTVDHTLHIGLGTGISGLLLDSLVVMWPDGEKQTLERVAVDRRMDLAQDDRPR